ncbi:MAG: TonB-dependent siderophore receptor [Pseudomonadota bacterium]
MISRPNTPAKLLAAAIQLALFGAHAHAADAEGVLPTVNITAQQENGYLVTRSAAGTKTDTPIIETPQSVSVVSAEQFTAQGARDLADAFSYTAGISRREGNDKTIDTFNIRGFQSIAGFGSIYRDGIKYTVNAYNGKQELYGLESVELLKGASSVLFGAAAPGGIINSVSKRARPDIVREINVQVGNQSHKQVSADLGGAIDADKKLSWRLTALGRDSDTMTDYVGDDRVYIAPAFTWQPNADTSLSVLAHYQNDKTAYAYGLPFEGTIVPNKNGTLPRNLYVADPSFNRYETTQRSLGYQFDHRFNSTTKLHHSLRYFKSDVVLPLIYTTGWAPVPASQSPRLMTRGAQDRDDRSHMYTTDTSLEHIVQTGPVQHKLLAGVDYTYAYHESERYTRTMAPLDLFKPVYGIQPGAERVLYEWFPKTKQRRLGIYAQDQIKFDKLTVLAGVRHDNTSDTTTPFAPPVVWAKETASATTGRVGAVYQFSNGIAPYASWSQSFEPVEGADRMGVHFKPTKGEQFEIGVRYQPAGGNTMISAAVYDLTQANGLAPDPVDFSMYVQQSEVRSRGFELEVNTALTKQIKLIAAYAYTDARMTKSTIPDYLGILGAPYIGKRTPGVPYNQLSVWGEYSAPFGVSGLKAGLGARYTGESVTQVPTANVGANTVLDAMLSYEQRNWRFALNARNLTDKNYIEYCNFSCFYGAAREIKLTAAYRW